MMIAMAGLGDDSLSEAALEDKSGLVLGDELPDDMSALESCSDTFTGSETEPVNCDLSSQLETRLLPVGDV